MIVAEADGMFGHLSVVDKDREARYLLIGQQIQGGAYLSPPGPGGEVPGPVAASSYMSGWLLAGAMNPSASALMIGLGSGCGAVALLHNFPALDLTVVDIDPAMIALATKHYPLLDHYQNMGRLQIVCSDATAYLQEALERGDHWDLALADAYEGTYDAVLPHDLLMGLALGADHLWFNLIGSPLDGRVDSLAFELVGLGKPVRRLFGTTDALSTQNLIVSTQDGDMGQADAFVPYKDLHGLEVEYAQGIYKAMLHREMPSIDFQDLHD